MGRCAERPYCRYSEVNVVEREIENVLSIFEVRGSTVGNVIDQLYVGC